ncbi:MAG: Na/Pi cotransporter family protein [Clostridiales bacterium]|nr:Na/Pi cotransporter family protein [Clostridiales bacterium]
MPLLAGVGLFLYGMSMLGGALEKLAGAGLEKILQKLTSNRIKGVLLGTGVTGVIQSSSATIVMAIGLLNAGIIQLAQALPVIMGANIGSTVTAQILRLGDLGGAGVFIKLLKPSAFGAILIALGACLYMFTKKNSTKNWGNISMGLGMIFFGMNTMEKTLLPLSEAEWFSSMLTVLQNPFLGILVGVAMTAVLQSSSASVGILQALSSTGAITFSSAMPIILGQNLGKCVTVVLASIGSKKSAKRAVLLDVLVNFSGLVVFAAVFYTIQGIWGFPFWDNVVNRGNIADFHTLFNVATTVILLPFCNQLIRLATKLVKDKALSSKEQEMARLDDLLIKTPSIALQQARGVIVSMGESALEAYRLARELNRKYTAEGMAKLNEAEEFLDRSEFALNNYILKITPNNLSGAENRMATELLHSLGDFERIGDHAVNISEVAQYNHENNVKFSPQGLAELEIIFNAVEEVLENTVSMYRLENLQEAATVEPLEQVVDNLEQEMRDRHIRRLQTGQCNVESGISFVELLTDLERISDHCSNIASNVIQRKSGHYLETPEEEEHIEQTYAYQQGFEMYSQKYQLPDAGAAEKK